MKDVGHDELNKESCPKDPKNAFYALALKVYVCLSTVKNLSRFSFVDDHGDVNEEFSC